MELNTLLKIVKKRSGAVMAIVLIFLISGSALTFSQPLKYRSRSRLLIISNLSADSYTVSKSNQYLSNLFSEVIYSSSFFDLTSNNSQYSIDKNYFNGSYKKQMKTWINTVETRSTGDSGILEISVYHQNPAQAKQISLAINNTLMTKSFNYQGTNQEQIKFNVIDQPIVSDYPVKPNIISNLSASLIFGLIFSLIYVYLFPSRKEKLVRRISENLNHNSRPQAKANYGLNHQEATKRVPKNINYTSPEGAYRPDYLYKNSDNLPPRKLETETENTNDSVDQDFEVRGNMRNILNN